ncbi:hypothetical protein pb186bvf_019970, partial [Paramecium bursaria]
LNFKWLVFSQIETIKQKCNVYKRYFNKQNFQIRRQESELSKKKLEQKNQLTKKQQEEDEKQRKYQEYLAKIAQIEELNRIKEQSLIEIGQAQRNAELFKQQQEIEKQQKEQFYQNFQEQSIIRYNDALEWKKQQFYETELGRAQLQQQQRSQTISIEKQKELTMISQYKEQSKNKTISMTQELDSYEKYDKNAPKRQILKPEDFANTCFHNPQVIRHDPYQEKENAMDKANDTLIQNQTILLEKAKQQRELERLQKERSKKALAKESQKKVLEQLEQESRFIKKEEAIQNQKKKYYPRQNLSSKHKQQELSQAFNNMFEGNSSGVIHTNHKTEQQKSRKTRSLSANQKEQKPKSVKIFTKPPLNTNIYGDSSNRDNYQEYPLQSPKEEKDINTSQKKRVQFNDPLKIEDQAELVQIEGQKSGLSQSYGDYQQTESLRDDPKITQKSVCEEEDEQTNEEQDDYEQQISEEEQSESERGQYEEQLQQGPKSNNIEDIKSYIKQQEAYLQKLEQQRINTTLKMKKQEEQLMNTFKNNRMIQRNTIPEESEDDVSSQQQVSQCEEYSHEESLSQQQQSNGDEYDPQEIMAQFLKPKKQQQQFFQQKNLEEQQSWQPKLDLSFQKQQQDQVYSSNTNQQSSNYQQSNLVSNQKTNTLQTFQSPNSELNYSLSEVKRDQISPNVQFRQQEYNQQQISEKQESQSQEEESLIRSSLQREQQEYDSAEQADYEETLGEIFQKRKAQLAKKFEQRQDQIKTVDKKGPSKEELVKIRKEMMKSKRQQSQDQKQEQQEQQIIQQEQQQDDKKSKLMSRLAMGEKVKVDKKEMLALTNKNYEQLPEIKQKKEQQEKNESIKQRKQKVKELDQKVRDQLKGKK